MVVRLPEVVAGLYFGHEHSRAPEHKAGGGVASRNRLIIRVEARWKSLAGHEETDGLLRCGKIDQCFIPVPLISLDDLTVTAEVLGCDDRR